jgi:hypothetical protein
MGLEIKLIAFLLGVVFLLVVFRNIRRNVFHPAYAVMWIAMSVFLLSVSLLEPIYKWLATSVLGIEDARHVIYIALIGFLLVQVFYLTAMISRMSNQIRQLISAEAILRLKQEDHSRGDQAKTPSLPGQSPRPA